MNPPFTDFDLKKFSKPPRRNSKSMLVPYQPDIPRQTRNAHKITSFVPNVSDKENTSSYIRSTKQIKFNLPEADLARAAGGRSRSILMTSSAINVAKLIDRPKVRSRWEESEYPSQNYDKPFMQSVKEGSNVFQKQSSLNYDNKAATTNYSFFDRKASKSKVENWEKDNQNSSCYVRDKSKSRSKFANTISSFEKSTVAEPDAPYFNQSRVMHATYNHPPSARSFKASQAYTKLALEERKESFGQLKLSDFLVGQCKGEGRFGKVFMAIHKRTGLLCALKKIKKESVKYMIDQFIQQVKIQLFLNHSKLVKVYGYFSDQEHFYMLIEYMEEGSLYSLMKKAKKFEEPEAVEKVYEICVGIKEMHDNNIVHRDLKPENVVITNGVCKICDFGWAAICQDRRQTYCGTLDYVCPEIIEGTSYDSSVDIWCLGVLVYEMLCGKAPFYDISRKKTMQKIVSCKIESFPPHLSRKAIQFIQMALQKDPICRVGIQELLNSDFLKGAKK